MMSLPRNQPANASIIAQVLSMNPLNLACNMAEEAMRNLCKQTLGRLRELS